MCFGWKINRLQTRGSDDVGLPESRLKTKRKFSGGVKGAVINQEETSFCKSKCH